MRFSIIALLIAFTACSSSNKTVKTNQQWVEEGYISVTIKDFSSLDGCTFLLVSEEDTKYLPVNLAQEFQKDGLSVWVKYHTLKSSMNICMQGIAISIDNIQLRN